MVAQKKIMVVSERTRLVYNLFQEPVEQPLLGFRIGEKKTQTDLKTRPTVLKTSGTAKPVIKTSGNRKGLLLLLSVVSIGLFLSHFAGFLTMEYIRSYNPLYEKGTKQNQNRPMETTFS